MKTTLWQVSFILIVIDLSLAGFWMLTRAKERSSLRLFLPGLGAMLLVPGFVWLAINAPRCAFLDSGNTRNLTLAVCYSILSTFAMASIVIARRRLLCVSPVEQAAQMPHFVAAVSTARLCTIFAVVVVLFQCLQFEIPIWLFVPGLGHSVYALSVLEPLWGFLHRIRQ